MDIRNIINESIKGFIKAVDRLIKEAIEELRA